VILPDTADRRTRDHDDLIRLGDGMPVWNAASGDSPADVQEAQAARKSRTAEENLRLLYVALTRARSWLIVAAAGEAKVEDSKGAKARGDWAWYRQVEAGLQALGANYDPQGRLRHQHGDWPSGPPDQHVARVATALPDWIALPAAEPPRDQGPWKPSDLGGAKALAGEGDETPIAMARGTVLHYLLEHLPQAPRAAWEAMTMAATPETLDPVALLAEAEAVLDMEETRFLFGPDALAEVQITGDYLGRQVDGILDRVVVSEHDVLIVDFKSNRVVPYAPELVPEGVLRQLGMYAHVLQQIYPTKRIHSAILWTAKAQWMKLPEGLVAQALGRVSLP